MLNESSNSVNQADAAAEKIPGVLTGNAGFLLNQTARLVREKITQALSPLKLTPRELGLLRILSASGPLSQQLLGRRHNTDRTTIVQLIDDLERRELVMRIENKNDRRSYMIHLTPRGKKVLNKAIKVAKKVQDDFLKPLTDEQWELMRTLLVKLIEFHL